MGSTRRAEKGTQVPLCRVSPTKYPLLSRHYSRRGDWLLDKEHGLGPDSFMCWFWCVDGDGGWEGHLGLEQWSLADRFWPACCQAFRGGALNLWSFRIGASRKTIAEGGSRIWSLPYANTSHSLMGVSHWWMNLPLANGSSECEREVPLTNVH